MRSLALILVAGVLLSACGRVDPEAELAAARASLTNEDYRRAAIHVSNVLQADPENAEARAVRGFIALANHDFQAAVDEFGRAVRLGFPAEDAALARAEAAMRSGDAEAALAVLGASSDRLDGGPEYWTLRGDVLLQVGSVAEADRAYRQSAELGPESARNIVGRAQLAAQRGAMEEAEALFGQAFELAPESLDVQRAAAAFYLRSARLEEAATALEAAARAYAHGQVSASEVGVLALLAQVYIDSNDLDAATSVVDRLAERAPNAPVSLYTEARIAYERGHLDEASSLAQSAVNAQPGNARFLTLLGAVQLRLGRLNQAERHLSAALSAAPGDPPAARLLAETRLLQQHPENTSAALQLALAYLVEQRPDDARRVATASLSAAPANAPETMALRATLGGIELLQGNLDEAERIGRTLNEAYPARHFGPLLIGEVRLAQGHHHEAAASFAEAYEREPAWSTLTRRIAALAGLEAPAEIGALLADWVAGNPDHVEGLMTYASHLHAAGRAPEALEYYERALDSEPESLIALNNAAWLRYELGEPGALGLAERARRRAPENPAVLDTLGWILVEQKREEEGIVLLQKAAESAPQALQIRYHLAQAQARLGQVEEARATLEALLSDGAGFAEWDDAQALLESL